MRTLRHGHHDCQLNSYLGFLPPKKTEEEEEVEEETIYPLGGVEFNVNSSYRWALDLGVCHKFHGSGGKKLSIGL